MSVSNNSQQSSNPNSNKNSTEEKEVQTVVKVYPFILDSHRTRATASSDKKFCTVLSLEASQSSKKFYSLLQYCPFYDIQENNLRVLDLPRKTKLQWVKHNRFSEDALKKLSLVDDDGVADTFTEMLLRMHSGKTPSYKEAEAQTDIMVRPYLLEEPRVATLYYSTGIQVSFPGCSHSATRHSV